jgi:hypothetical protein
MTKLASYRNGNTNVVIFEDGTKERTWEGVPAPVHPESADIKITNYCDNPICRAHCHEMSNKQGVHGHLHEQLGFFDGLPPGVELAIGGGNPLSHPQLGSFLELLQARGLVPNLTVNQWHLRSSQIAQLVMLAKWKLVYGIGISFMPQCHYQPKLDEFLTRYPNCVWHVIAGVHSVPQVQKLLKMSPCKKVLILGYKDFGMGVAYHSLEVDQRLNEWRACLPYLFQEGRTLSFDNLALEQLQVKSILRPEVWEEFYLGDDGSFTMYADLVKQQFAVSSTSEKQPINGRTIVEAFQHISNLPR